MGELKDEPLTRNLPSDNMSMGVRNTKIEDEEMENAVRSNTRRAVIGKKGRIVLATEAGAFEEEKKFELSLNDEDGAGVSAIDATTKEVDAIMDSGLAAGGTPARKRWAFSRSSWIVAVYMAATLHTTSKASIPTKPVLTTHHTVARGVDGEGYESDGDDEAGAKKKRKEEETVLEVRSSARCRRPCVKRVRAGPGTGTGTGTEQQQQQ